MCILNILSQFVASIFTFLMKDFDEERLLILMKSNLSIFFPFLISAFYILFEISLLQIMKTFSWNFYFTSHLQVNSSIWYQVEVKVHFFLFFMLFQLFQHQSKRLSYSFQIHWNLCQKSIDHVQFSFQFLYSVPLIYLSKFMPSSYCLHY